jgi:trk system potassium uptake protein TrkH
LHKKFFSPPRLIAFSFLLTILIGTLLLHLPFATTDGEGLKWIDAFFTATSATCVTGLIVVNTATDLTVFGQILVMIMIQIGGLGLMTVATLFAILLGKKISFKRRLMMQEALNQITPAGIIKLTKYILQFTFITELTGALLLATRWFPKLGFKSFYYGLFHAISAFNNAGFDLFGNSLENFKDDWYINLVILSLFIGSGLGFTVIAEIYNKGVKNFHSYSLHSKLVLLITGVLLLAGFLIVLLFEYNNAETLGELSFPNKLLAAFFQGATPRTAGFNTIPIGEMRTPTLLFLLSLMFIGASPASTGGGIKTTTFGTIIMAVFATIKGREETVVFERKIPPTNIFKALSVILIGLIIISIVTMFLSLSENAPILDITFEVFSAFGTVGLSTGLTSKLTNIGKVIIAITMFTGRVGPLTLAFAFTQRQNAARVGYPEEKVIIG